MRDCNWDHWLPVAIGLGEGGEFYRPMAVAIEISRDRAIAKFRSRNERMNPFFAFVLTIIEALLTLTMARFLYRIVKKLFSSFLRGRESGSKPGEGKDVVTQPGD